MDLPPLSHKRHVSKRNASGGCFVGMVAIASSAFPIAGIWGMSKWLVLDPTVRQLNSYFWAMFVAVLVGGVITLLMTFLAWRMMKR